MCMPLCLYIATSRTSYEATYLLLSSVCLLSYLLTDLHLLDLRTTLPPPSKNHSGICEYK